MPSLSNLTTDAAFLVLIPLHSHQNWVAYHGERYQEAFRLRNLASYGPSQLLRDCTQAYWYNHVSVSLPHQQFLSVAGLPSALALFWLRAEVLTYFIGFLQTHGLRLKGIEPKKATTMKWMLTPLYAPSRDQTSAADLILRASSYYVVSSYIHNCALLNSGGFF